MAKIERLKQLLSKHLSDQGRDIWYSIVIPATLESFVNWMKFCCTFRVLDWVVVANQGSNTLTCLKRDSVSGVLSICNSICGIGSPVALVA